MPAGDDAERPRTALPVVDVLTSVPIDGAVFTTFTLSLAWFETYLLRALERAGAKQILLLADPVGVNASLGEGLVTGTGVRYAVEPVDAPNGAFHAKVGILWSRDSLVVAVGSGNLTFAGMHRNLECWEVLTAGIPCSDARRLHRSVAEDALAFVGYLQGRVDPGGRAATTLAAASSALKTWLPRLPGEAAPVRWLDSTREAVGAQLVRHLGHGQERRLQVLSPFHDRDGAAVTRLAQQLGATTVEVLYIGSTTTYPLGREAKNRGVVVRRVEVEDQKRPLHAKVFHVVGKDGAHVVSGSANATSQALWTTGNVEVSLLRAGAFDDFLPTVPGTPDVEVLEYKAPESQVLTIQWARAGDDHVRVHLRWRGDMTPSALLVGFVDALDPPISVAWPADGVVRVRLPATFNALRPRALRVEATVIEADQRWSARSWVAFDELLNASREYRAALSAWNRILLGEDGDGVDDEDDAVLLRMFAEEHAQTTEAIGAGRVRQHAARGERQEGDAEETSIPIRLIEALTRVPQSTGSATTSPGGTFIDDVEQAMRAAFGALGERAALDDEEEDEPGDGARRAKRAPSLLPRSVRQALGDFESAFIEAANGMERPPEKPSHVLAYATLCARLVLRYRLLDTENRASFWSSTANLVRTLLCPLTGRAPLVSLLHVPGTALADDAARLLALLVTLIAWHDGGGRLEGEGEVASQAMRADVLREALAALDRAAEATVLPCALPRSLDEVFPEIPEVLTALLARMRESPSASDRAMGLKVHLQAIVRGEAQPAKDGPDREVSRDARRTPPLFVTPWIESCPRCHQVLAAVVRTRLLMRQPQQCRNTRCSRWLVPSEGT